MGTSSPSAALPSSTPKKGGSRRNDTSRGSRGRPGTVGCRARLVRADLRAKSYGYLRRSVGSAGLPIGRACAGHLPKLRERTGAEPEAL